MLDVLCDVDVLVGHGSITVRDCLQLRRNTVIRLNEPAGSDLQLRVEGVPTARGEAAVDDDTTSVRLSEMIAPPNAEGRT
jgi:flagellar motor switch/type III secretory pathway protein FliN